MINMMKADLYRLLRSKAFYIAAAIMVLMIGMSIYIVQPGYIGTTMGSTVVDDSFENAMSEMSYEEISNMSVGDIRKMMLDVEGYELDKDILAANMNLYYVFIFIAVVILTSDFSCGGIKNTLSSAISRRKYYWSKLTLTMLCCIVMLFLNTYITYFANIIFNGKNLSSSLGTVTMVTIKQLPPVFALISILTGIGFTVKKTAIFNTLAIPFTMIVQLLMSLAVRILKVKSGFLDYELQTMLSKLTIHQSDSYILRSYLVCAAIIVVFNLVGYLSFIKSEIK